MHKPSHDFSAVSRLFLVTTLSLSWATTSPTTICSGCFSPVASCYSCWGVLFSASQSGYEGFFVPRRTNEMCNPQRNFFARRCPLLFRFQFHHLVSLKYHKGDNIYHLVLSFFPAPPLPPAALLRWLAVRCIPCPIPESNSILDVSRESFRRFFPPVEKGISFWWRQTHA